MKLYLVPFTVALVSQFKQARAIQTHQATVLAQARADDIEEVDYLYANIGERKLINIPLKAIVTEGDEE